MKLHRDNDRGVNRISAYGPGYFVIEETRYEHGVAVVPGREVHAWTPRDPARLDTAAFDVVEDLEADVLIIGTGRHQRFPSPEVLAHLHARGLGVEVMSTDAACRTYNVLASEARRVAALLVAIDG